MARPISEQELQLKKRARRRLVGAIVLVTGVAVVLPMVLDSEPKPVNQNVEIRIPSADSGELKSKGTSSGQAAVSGGEVTDRKAEAGASTSPDAASATSPPAPAAEKPAVSEAPTLITRRMDGQGIPQPPPGERKEAAAASETAEPSKPAPVTEKSKPVTTTETSKPAPVAEKSKPAVAAEPAKPKTATDTAKAKTSTETAKAAAPAESPRRATEPVSATGAYVVQVAALSDAAKAKQLQKQMSGAGVTTYTEVVSTKTGEITRVRAGPYATRDAAEKVRAQLKKAGLEGQVVQK
jgi:DedD protein